MSPQNTVSRDLAAMEEACARAFLTYLGHETMESSIQLSFFYIMYFSLPKDTPPHPLGKTRVRKHWSAIIYAVIADFHALYCSRHGFLHQRMNTNGTGTK